MCCVRLCCVSPAVSDSLYVVLTLLGRGHGGGCHPGPAVAAVWAGERVIELCHGLLVTPRMLAILLWSLLFPFCLGLSTFLKECGPGQDKQWEQGPPSRADTPGRGELCPAGWCSGCV